MRRKAVVPGAGHHLPGGHGPFTGTWLIQAAVADRLCHDRAPSRRKGDSPHSPENTVHGRRKADRRLFCVSRNQRRRARSLRASLTAARNAANTVPNRLIVIIVSLIACPLQLTEAPSLTMSPEAPMK